MYILLASSSVSLFEITAWSVIILCIYIFGTTSRSADQSPEADGIAHVTRAIEAADRVS